MYEFLSALANSNNTLGMLVSLGFALSLLHTQCIITILIRKQNISTNHKLYLSSISVQNNLNFVSVLNVEIS